MTLLYWSQNQVHFNIHKGLLTVYLHVRLDWVKGPPSPTTVPNIILKLEPKQTSC